MEIIRFDGLVKKPKRIKNITNDGKIVCVFWNLISIQKRCGTYGCIVSKACT